MTEQRRTPPHILIGALKILANDIQSSDGIANAAIAEAADTMEQLWRLQNLTMAMRMAQKNYQKTQSEQHANEQKVLEAHVDVALEKASELWRNL